MWCACKWRRLLYDVGHLKGELEFGFQFKVQIKLVLIHLLGKEKHRVSAKTLSSISPLQKHTCTVADYWG